VLRILPIHRRRQTSRQLTGLSAHELKEWLIIPSIRLTQRSDIPFSYFASRDQIALAPSEGPLIVLNEEQVRHHPGKSAIPVWERMDMDKTVMKARSDLADWKTAVAQLSCDFVAELFETNRDVLWSQARAWFSSLTARL